MFDFDAGKIIIVGVIALIFIPPKDLPRVMRQVGQFVSKMRRMASEFQGQFMDAMREADMADLKREAQELSDAARASTGLDDLRDINRHMTNTLKRSSAPQSESAVGAEIQSGPEPHDPSHDLRPTPQLMPADDSAAACEGSHEPSIVPDPSHDGATPASTALDAGGEHVSHDRARASETVGYSA